MADGSVHPRAGATCMARMSLIVKDIVFLSVLGAKG
jgi:hypothetical protein